MRESPISLRVILSEGRTFFLVDKGSDWASYDSHREMSSEEALLSHVGTAGNHAILVGAAGDVADDVPVTIRLRPGPPDDAEAYDHVVEVSLRCESGVMEILDQPEVVSSEIRLPSPGDYRVRVSMSNIDSADEEEPSDSYHIEVWPGDLDERRIVKWWEPWKPGPAPVIPGRRSIYGIDNFQRAVVDMSPLARREMEPDPKIREFLPEGYMETAILYRAGDGTYWEYTTEPPQRVPLLTELTEAEAQEFYELE